MELDLGKIKHDDLSYEGDVFIELPSHFVLLPYHERNEALNSPTRHRLIVAAGREPDGSVVIVSGRGRIHTMDTERFILPRGRVIPNEQGRVLDFVDAGKTIDAAELLHLF